MKNIFPILFSIFLTLNCFAQSPEWIVYDTSNSGLPSNNVSSIIEYPNNVFWIGTYGGGLARYEDSVWTVYNTLNSGIPSNNIYDIAVDMNGRKWIGTSQGLAVFNDSTWTVYNTNNPGFPCTYNSVSAVVADQYQNIWFGSSSCGPVRFDGNSWTSYSFQCPNFALVDMLITDITATDGEIWVGSWDYDKGLCGCILVYDYTSWTIYGANPPERPFCHVWNITVDNQNNKWMATSSGIAQFDGVNWNHFSMDSLCIPSTCNFEIAVDSKGNKWLGMRGGGLVKFSGINGNTSIIYNNTNSLLPNNIIRTVYLDHNENLWMGTDSGLAVFREGGVLTDISNRLPLPIHKRWLNIFPNPANHNTVIRIYHPVESYMSLLLTNVLGQLINVIDKGKKPAGEYSYKLNINELPVGVYIVQYTTNNFTINKKIVKIR